MTEPIRATGGDVLVRNCASAEASTSQQLVAVASATGLQVHSVRYAVTATEDAMLANITDELLDGR